MWNSDLYIFVVVVVLQLLNKWEHLFGFVLSFLLIKFVVSKIKIIVPANKMWIVSDNEYRYCIQLKRAQNSVFPIAHFILSNFNNFISNSVVYIIFFLCFFFFLFFPFFCMSKCQLKNISTQKIFRISLQKWLTIFICFEF